MKERYKKSQFSEASAKELLVPSIARRFVTLNQKRGNRNFSQGRGRRSTMGKEDEAVMLNVYEESSQKSMSPVSPQKKDDEKIPDNHITLTHPEEDSPVINSELTKFKVFFPQFLI